MRFITLFLAASILVTASAAGAGATGAVETGHYRNLFREWRPSIEERAIDAKLMRYWRSLFEGDADQRVYFLAAPTADGPAAYILDVGNDDVRSEGMSYGMMLAVQMNRKPEFDALWNWASTYMRYDNGPRAGYFRWQCTRTGCPIDSVPASDGEEYIATALLMAAGRWGNDRGRFDYARHANAILDAMLHKQDINGGVVAGVTDMFDAKTNQVVFVPKAAPPASPTRPIICRRSTNYGRGTRRGGGAGRLRIAPGGERLPRSAAASSPARPIRKPDCPPTMPRSTGNPRRSTAMAISVSTHSGPRQTGRSTRRGGERTRRRRR